MELDEFHVRDFGSGSVGHRNSRSAGDVGIAGVKIHLAGAAAGDDRRRRQHRQHLPTIDVQHVSAETPSRTLRGALGGHHQVDGDVEFQHGDVFHRPNRLDHHSFQFGSGDIAGVQDPALVVAAFAPQVEFVAAVGVPQIAAGGELGAQVDDVAYRFGTGFHDGSHRLFVAQTGAGVERVLNMLVKRVQRIHDTGDSALRQPTVAFIDLPFGDHGDPPSGAAEVQGAGQPGQTAADDDMVKLQNIVVRHNCLNSNEIAGNLLKCTSKGVFFKNIRLGTGVFSAF